MNLKREALALHKKHKGKLQVCSKYAIKNHKDLALSYTPGVAEPCREIAKNKKKVYDYTIKGNSIAVVSDGSAVLGLGNIGAEASLPVMEGKAILFKKFANINAFPICLDKQDIQSTIDTVKNIAPAFGGINLEDIKAPECFIIENALQDLGIPVMHDDQHGTAVVVLAGIINSLKIVKKNIQDIRIVINGTGAAGVGISNLLLSSGMPGKHIIMCDSKGIVYKNRKDLVANKFKSEIASKTNLTIKKGNLEDAMNDADIFIGVSKGNIVSKKMVSSMARDAIIFAMANPDPEILPKNAYAAGAKIVATGRSDFDNQVNNVLSFPGIFKGALDAKATRITNEMKCSAAYALAKMVKKPTIKRILPEATNLKVADSIAKAVKKAWKN